MSCKNYLSAEVQEVLTSTPALAIEHLPAFACCKCQKVNSVFSPQTVCDECSAELNQALGNQGSLVGLLIDFNRTLGNFTQALAPVALDLLNNPTVGNFTRTGDRDFQIQFSTPIQCAEDIENFNRVLTDLDKVGFGNVSQLKKLLGEDLKKLYGVTPGQVVNQLNQKTDAEDAELLEKISLNEKVEQTVNSILSLYPTENQSAANINKNRELLKTEIARALYNLGKEQKTLVSTAELTNNSCQVNAWEELNYHYHFAQKCEELQTYYEYRQKTTGQALPTWLLAAQLFKNSQLAPPSFVFQPVLAAHGSLIRKAHMLRKLYTDRKASQAAITQHHYYKGIFNNLVPSALKDFTATLSQFPQRNTLPQQWFNEYNQNNPQATFATTNKIEELIGRGAEHLNSPELRSFFSVSDQSQQNLLTLKKNVVFEQQLSSLRNSLQGMAGIRKLVDAEKEGKPGIQAYLRDCLTMGVVRNLEHTLSPDQRQELLTWRQQSLAQYQPLSAPQRLTLKNLAQKNGVLLT